MQCIRSYGKLLLSVSRLYDNIQHWMNNPPSSQIRYQTWAWIIESWTVMETFLGQSAQTLIEGGGGWRRGLVGGPGGGGVSEKPSAISSLGHQISNKSVKSKCCHQADDSPPWHYKSQLHPHPCPCHRLVRIKLSRLGKNNITTCHVCHNYSLQRKVRWYFLLSGNISGSHWCLNFRHWRHYIFS